MAQKFITNSVKETKKIGEKLAGEVLLQKSKKIAIILALQGNLGSGKTTFLQGFAKGLEIKEKILSPTFVIYKKFKIITVPKNRRSSIFWHKYFYHFDCYRLKNEKDILDLLDFSARGANVQDRSALGVRPASGWKEIISNPENIVAIEWPEKIKKILPKNATIIKFKFINENTREIFFVQKQSVRYNK